MHEFTLSINNESIGSDSYFPVINPATEEKIADCPNASLAQVNAAVDAADSAFYQWANDEAMRRDCLLKASKAIAAKREQFARLLTQEQGKPLANAFDEVDGVIHRFARMSHVEIPVDVLQDDEEIKVAVYRRPLGVVAFIVPWNYPLSMAAKMTTPLLIGNTIVLKPSPYTPLTALLLGKVLQDIFPAGVINVISGSDQSGAWLTEHPKVRMIGFTGSVSTGLNIAKVAANDLKRVSLELGGNDPAIVLQDANPKEVAPKIFWGAFSNAGQICTAIKRLYIHKNLFHPMVEELAQLAKSVNLGNGLEPNVTMGPVNNKMQFERISELVSDAKASGKILAGGKAKGTKGYFFKPTLITDLSDDARIVKEEQFGPALPILVFDDVEDVIMRCNNTMMGLGSSVWSSNWQHAAEVASRMQSGVAWVNRNFATHPLAPFGGFKHSGIGREGGPWGLAAYSEIQTMSIAK